MPHDKQKLCNNIGCLKRKFCAHYLAFPRTNQGYENKGTPWETRCLNKLDMGQYVGVLLEWRDADAVVNAMRRQEA